MMRLGVGEPEIDVSVIQAVLGTPQYGSFLHEPDLQLVTNWQTAEVWTHEVTNVGISESNGVFTFTESGIYHIILERVYMNYDTRPEAEPVMVHIRSVVNGVGANERSAPIDSAIKSTKPSVISFTTPKILLLTAGDTLSFQFKSDDDGGDPEDVRMVKASLTIHKIYKV